jgi:hypothetical protein
LVEIGALGGKGFASIKDLLGACRSRSVSS